MPSHCYFIATSGHEGAIPFHFKELANTLAKRGNRVIILIPERKIDQENHVTNPAIYVWPSMRPTKLRDAFYLFKLIRYFKPDCLIANFSAVNIMMLVGWLSRVPHRVCWYHTVSGAPDLEREYHNLSVTKYKLKRLRKRPIYWMATKIVAVSQAARDDLCRIFHIDRGKSIVLYNALRDPLPLPVKQNLASQPYKLSCVGNLSIIKGQDVLIRAISICKNYFPNFSLQLIGQGPMQSHLYDLASELGLLDHCIFTGAVSHAQVIEYMASSYLTIVPSRSEAFGFVVIESMAVGTPVVATNVGGIPEIVRDGVDGFLVPPDDPDKMGEKLLLLLTNPELRATMAKNARQRFLENFEQKNSVLLQANWLEGLVNGLTAP
jgi:glycosyltransferase involved in cell wall biosynthesis